MEISFSIVLERNGISTLLDLVALGIADALPGPTLPRIALETVTMVRYDLSKAHCLTRNQTLRLPPNSFFANHFCIFTACNRYTNFPSPKREEASIMRFKRQISGLTTAFGESAC
jgi:hypothetical protein